MDIKRKATRINLRDFTSPQMRAFHMSWFAFFLCFFAWFGIAPLMKVIRSELHLTAAQVGNTIIASVAITVIARLLVGMICDRIGPRLAYTWLLILGSLPVMGIGLAHSYLTFVLFRLAIGAIGASFVITQYHTSIMFAPNVVGTANAASAGWGNLGGGVTQLVMPLIFAGFLALGLSAGGSWRACMVVAGIVCFLTGIAYYFLTQDAPTGNFKQLRQRGELPPSKPAMKNLAEVSRDPRVWLLFIVYAGCFGIELTIDNVAALYFTDYFHMTLAAAGVTAGLFGLMNIFGRAAGGIVGDRMGAAAGLRGRVSWLFAVILLEGILLMIFSRVNVLGPAIVALVAFSLFVQMGCGATYAVVPFINKRAMGSVSGIVGAGGNAGAVAAGFLFKGALAWPTGFLILGALVTGASFLALGVRFSEEDERAASLEIAQRLQEFGAEPEMAGVAL
jgi:NNP family nitrate/nitrite transporter-like MFS transporter